MGQPANGQGDARSRNRLPLPVPGAGVVEEPTASDGPTIRAVDPRSAEARSLVAAFFAEIEMRYPGFDPGRQPPAPDDVFLTEHGGIFLLAHVADTPVGCVGLRRLAEGTAEVRRVMVLSQARGQGLGQRLLEAVLEQGRVLGYDRFRLTTGDRQPEALALFRALGFRVIPAFDANPYATYWMELATCPGEALVHGRELSSGASS